MTEGLTVWLAASVSHWTHGVGPRVGATGHGVSTRDGGRDGKKKRRALSYKPKKWRDGRWRGNPTTSHARK